MIALRRYRLRACPLRYHLAEARMCLQSWRYPEANHCCCSTAMHYLQTPHSNPVSAFYLTMTGSLPFANHARVHTPPYVCCYFYLYKAYHMPDHRLIMLYAAFQNKMHGNIYCTWSRYNPKLIDTHKKTRESTYSKPKTGTRFYLNRATGQRQKRMPPKHCMNLVYKKNKFSGRCYANDP